MVMISVSHVFVRRRYTEGSQFDPGLNQSASDSKFCFFALLIFGAANAQYFVVPYFGYTVAEENIRQPSGGKSVR